MRLRMVEVLLSWLIVMIGLVGVGLRDSSVFGATVPVLFDDFKGTSFNATLWTVTMSGGPTIQSANDTAVIDFPSNSSGASFWAGLDLNFCVSGDFNATVYYTIVGNSLVWPSLNGVRIDFALRESNGALGEVARSSLNVNDPPPIAPSPGEWYQTNWAFGTAPNIVTPYRTTDNAGYLEVMRSGSTVSGLFRGPAASAYTLVASQTVDSTRFPDLDIIIAAHSHDYDFIRQEVKLAFDKFTLQTGTLVPPSPACNTSGPIVPPERVGGGGTAMSIDKTGLFALYVGSPAVATILVGTLVFVLHARRAKKHAG